MWLSYSLTTWILKLSLYLLTVLVVILLLQFFNISILPLNIIQDVTQSLALPQGFRSFESFGSLSVSVDNPPAVSAS